MSSPHEDAGSEASFQQLPDPETAASVPAAAAAAPPIEDRSPSTSFVFAPDATSAALNIDLTQLNWPIVTHGDALHQLHLAKQDIERVQVDNALLAARSRKGVSPSHTAGKPLRLTSMAAADGTESLLAHDASESSFSVGAHMAAEAEEDAPMAAHQEESIESYYETPWWRLILKRLPWLIGLLLLQSFGALILNSYNKLISQHLVLNFFIPMMQGTAGSAGAQPGVMMTRALGTGQLHLSRILCKEGPVAMIMAVTLALVAWLRIHWVYPDEPGSALSIAIALFLAVMISVTLSIVFSIVLHKSTCCDPADGAVPLLSTVSDVLSILVLMQIAHQIVPTRKDQ